MIDSLSRPQPKRQVGRFLMASMAVVLVLVLLPVRSSWNDFKAAQTDYQVIKDQELYYQGRRGEANQAMRNIPAITGEILGLETMLARRTRQLRTTVETAGIQEEIRDLVQRRGLSNFNLSSRAESEHEGYQLRSLMLNVEGTFQGLLRFLNEVRSMNTVLQVGQVNISGSPDPNRSALVMSVELRLVLVEDQFNFEGIRAVLNDSTWASTAIPLPEGSGPPPVSAPQDTSPASPGSDVSAAPDDLPASPVTDVSEPVREDVLPAPVRLENFDQRRPQPGVIELRFRLAKSEQDGSLLRGYLVAVVEDRARPGSALTNPPMDTRDGRPVDPREGDPFAISRYKPLVYRLETPPDFVMGDIRILVYNAEGELILERTWGDAR